MEKKMNVGVTGSDCQAEENASTKVKKEQSETEELENGPWDMNDCDNDDDDVTLHACDICCRTFPSDRLLRKHKTDHKKNRKKKHECGKCLLLFADLGTFISHLKQHCLKEGEPTEGCSGTIKKCNVSHEDEVTENKMMCGETFVSQHASITHSKKMPDCPQQFECSKCLLLFDAVTKYDAHLAQHKLEENLESCQACHASFTPETIVEISCAACGEKTRTNFQAFSLARGRSCGAGHQPMRSKDQGNARVIGKSCYQSETIMKVKEWDCVCELKPFAEVPHPSKTVSGECVIEREENIKNDDETTNEPAEEQGTETNSTKSQLRDHEIIHRPFHCELCDKTFNRKSELTKHQWLHNGERAYHCDECGHSFTRKTHLTSHMLTHSGVKPYECVECDKSFTQSSNLHKHVMLIHRTDKPHECVQCGMRFSLKSQLSEHIQVQPKDHTLKDTEAKPYHCDQCEKSYKTKNGLVEHLLIHGDSENLHHCHICGKSFQSRSILRGHLWTHSDTKPHQCDMCPRAFAKKSDLTRHVFVHSGTKPFNCDVCGKSFTERWHYNQHVMTHARGKLYQCDICHRSYSQKSSLLRHKESCHANNTVTDPKHVRWCQTWKKRGKSNRRDIATRARNANEGPGENPEVTSHSQQMASSQVVTSSQAVENKLEPLSID